jgi:nucleotide-binding universal stress UspA family protein
MNNSLDKTATAERLVSKYDLSIKEIVVAVDLSAHSEKTVTYAAAFAKNVGAALTLVHIFSHQPVDTFNAYETAAEEARHNSERKLVSLADKTRATGVACDIRFGIGDPAEEITHIAQSLNADLIITASHQTTLLSRLLGLGQASRILHRAGCPVLVYHEGIQ